MHRAVRIVVSGVLALGILAAGAGRADAFCIGLVAIFESNPTTLFRTHANRLKNAGL